MSAHAQTAPEPRSGPGTRAAPQRLGGIVAAALTPVRADLAIDLPRLAAHVRWLLAEGCHAVSLFGTTGEGPSFTVDAKLAALAALIAEGMPAGRLIPASMSPAVADARRTVEAAAAHGCRAVLLLPPFYYAAEPAGVADFVGAVAAHGELPLDIVLYHIPSLARTGYGVDLIERLTGTFGPRIAGIKDSTGERAHTVALARRFPQLAVFSGLDRDLPALMAAGGAGLIGGMPNVNPRDLRTWFDAPDSPEGTRLLARINAFLDVVVSFGGPAPLKSLLALHRADDAWLRMMPPLRPQEPAARERIRKAFTDAGFRFGIAAG